jgi:serine/threonine-protein kinase
VPLEPGQSIDGKYRVGRLIGEGGMGTVYEGENVRIGRRVAIKVLHEQVASRPEFAARFEREARAAAKIGSPHICDVLDLGDLPNGEKFIVMEFLEGQSLEARMIEHARIPEDALLSIAFEMLEALATMHNAGVVHRDLKPANVYLSKTSVGRGEAVKILDFGVSKFMPAPGESSDMTSTGTMMGTPLYMSPEQARGMREIDGRADIYSASVIFYRALTGVLPFTAENFNELMFKIALEEPRSIRELAPDVDAELASIIHRGLGRTADSRWQTAREYQEAIVGWARARNRLTFSMMRAPSERILAVSARVGGNTQPIPPVGTPTAWSEEGPLAMDGTAILGPETKQKDAGSQTMASSGMTPPDAAARSIAEPPAQKKWVLPAAAVAIVVVLGGIGWKLGSRNAAIAPPPPAVAVTAPAPSPSPLPPPIIAPALPVETAPAPVASSATPEPTPSPSPTHAALPAARPKTTATTPTAAASAAPAPSPTTSAKRVFRTTID